MTPSALRSISLYADLQALFEAAKEGRNYGLNALPEEQIANLLVERLAPVLIEAEAEIERLSRPRAA